MRISDWSSDVCSSDLQPALGGAELITRQRRRRGARPAGADRAQAVAPSDIVERRVIFDVQEDTVAQPVIGVGRFGPIVGEKDEEGIVIFIRRLQMRDQPADLAVHRGDREGTSLNYS